MRAGVLFAGLASGCLNVEAGVGGMGAGADTALEEPPSGCASGSLLLASVDSIYCLNLGSFDLRRIELEAPNAFGIVDGLALNEGGQLFSLCFGDLYEVELDRGVFRWIGATEDGCALTGLPDGRLLGTGLGTGGNLDSLYAINPKNGEAVQVVSGSEFNVDGDLALHPDGFVYWTVAERGDLQQSHLLRVDPRSWEVSYVGAFAVDWILSLAYVDDRLLGASATESGIIYEIDPGTAEVSEVYELDDWIFDATAAPWW